MKGVLLRVGCDTTTQGGSWNAPVDPHSWKYAYVPIPGEENRHDHLGTCPTYKLFRASVREFGVDLPAQLGDQTKIHLDPDFATLTYGDADGPRGKTLANFREGDFITFFAAFQPVRQSGHALEYCLIGIFYLSRVCRVKDLTRDERMHCAHGRRIGVENDYVFFAHPEKSGRFQKAIPIAEFRGRAYRVRLDLLSEWGGLMVRDGYIQRSARPPLFANPSRFLLWLDAQIDGGTLIREN